MELQFRRPGSQSDFLFRQMRGKRSADDVGVAHYHHPRAMQKSNISTVKSRNRSFKHSMINAAIPSPGGCCKELPWQSSCFSNRTLAYVVACSGMPRFIYRWIVTKSAWTSLRRNSICSSPAWEKPIQSTSKDSAHGCVCKALFPEYGNYGLRSIPPLSASKPKESVCLICYCFYCIIRKRAKPSGWKLVCYDAASAKSSIEENRKPKCLRNMGSFLKYILKFE